MENLITKTEDGKLGVSSRRVADDFKKRHSDVIEKIQQLIKAEKSVMSMFIESSYKAGTGKNYKEYLLNGNNKCYENYLYTIESRKKLSDKRLNKELFMVNFITKLWKGSKL